MKSLSLVLTAALAALATVHTAFAHIGYGGRDFGTLVNGAPISVIGNQTISSAFGWADATDADYGDSHRGRFFRFSLTQTTSVTITAERNTNGTGTPDTFLPAISLFAGLAQLAPERAAHDSSALSVASRPPGTEGSFRALTDWSIGNDPTYNISGDPTSGTAIEARLAFLTYIGHTADGTSVNYGDAFGIDGDGLADGFITGTFSNLAPGDYSLFVGGANYAAQLVETGAPYPTYGVTVSIQAIPEPSSFAIIAGFAALASLGLRRRR